MGEQYLKAMRMALAAKSSDELLGIWRENDRNEWRPEAFEIVAEILTRRGVTLPSQKLFDAKEWAEKELDHQEGRSRVLAYIIAIPFFVVVYPFVVLLLYCSTPLLGEKFFIYGTIGAVFGVWEIIGELVLIRMKRRAKSKLLERAEQGTI